MGRGVLTAVGLAAVMLAAQLPMGVLPTGTAEPSGLQPDPGPDDTQRPAIPGLDDCPPDKDEPIGWSLDGDETVEWYQDGEGSVRPLESWCRPDGWLVEVSKEPLAAGSATLSALEDELDRAVQDIRTIAPGARVSARFSTVFHGVAINATEAQATALEDAGFRVWPNVPVRGFLDESVSAVRAPEAWSQGVGPAGAVPQRGLGMRVAVIDTGIDFTHPDLGGCFGPPCKVAGGYNVVEPLKPPLDDHYHGTHVAAIAAGNGHFQGVAPDATLLAYKVLDEEGRGFASWIIEGLERAVDPDQDGDFEDRADVISLSLGGRGDPDDPMSQAVDNSVAAGSVVTVAAGNTGCGINRILDSFHGAVCSPGTARRAITVGASSIGSSGVGPGYGAWFSAAGPVEWSGKTMAKPDVVAPGIDICAARAAIDHMNNPEQVMCGPDHIELSGTSMATPHAAGVAALILQGDPGRSPVDVKAGIMNGAAPVASRSWEDIGTHAMVHGSGFLDAVGSVDAADNPPVALFHDVPLTDWPNLTGEVDVSALSHWTLEAAPFYADNADAVWQPLVNSTTFNGTIANRLPLPEGGHLLRLQAVDAAGQSSSHFAYVDIDKIGFKHPLTGDVFRTGTELPVSLEIHPDLTVKHAVLEYGSVGGYYDPKDCLSDTCRETPDEWTQIANTTDVSTLDFPTAGLSDGFYHLRVNLEYVGSLIVDEARVVVLLDSTLLSGFPARTPVGDCSDGPCFNSPIRDVVVEDFEGDGQSEIVVGVRSMVGPSYLQIIGSDGETVDRIAYGEKSWSRIGGPLAVDVDGDGGKEIVAVGGMSADDAVRLFAFEGNGSAVPGWPVRLPEADLTDTIWKVTLTAADLDADGVDEIVVRMDPTDLQKPHLYVVESNGSLVSHWQLPDPGWGSWDLVPVAAAQLDGTPGLELVTYANVYSDTLGSTSEIHAFDQWGNLLPGWPALTEFQAREPFAVADVDGDGLDEVATGSKYFGLSSGKEHSGLAILASDGTQFADSVYEPLLSSGAALADVDGDSKPELLYTTLWDTSVHPYEKNKVHVQELNGTPLPGWPRGTCWVAPAAPAVADIDGDSEVEVLAGSVGHYCLGITNFWMPEAGGVYGWHSNGTRVAGFPRVTEGVVGVPPIVADLDGDSDVEILALTEPELEYYDINYEGFHEAPHKHRHSLYAWP